MAFNQKDYKKALSKAFRGGFLFTPRMRLACVLKNTAGNELGEYHVTNDFALHRGAESQLLKLDCHVNDSFLTTVVGDGLLVATPTGSTAYSASCGGSMIHPVIQAILMTPICPRSLSFRPILLPKDSNVRVRWAPSGNEGSFAVAQFDGGRFSTRFDQDSVINISMSPYPLLTINAKSDDWVRDINHQLMWNANLRRHKPEREVE